jgi:hypothetical protein
MQLAEFLVEDKNCVYILLKRCCCCWVLMEIRVAAGALHGHMIFHWKM